MKQPPFRDSLMIDYVKDEATGKPRIQLGIASENGDNIHFVMELNSAEELAHVILQLCGEARAEAGMAPMPRLGTN